jgi:mRNA interferase MazF
MTSSNIPRRGEVWIVDLDPTRGAEIQKQRTAVVMSTDSLAKLPIHIIVSITGWKSSFASSIWFYKIVPMKKNGLIKESSADSLQLRSVSRERFIKKIGQLDAEQLEEIAYRVALCIGLRPL